MLHDAMLVGHVNQIKWVQDESLESDGSVVEINKTHLFMALLLVPSHPQT